MAWVHTGKMNNKTRQRGSWQDPIAVKLFWVYLNSYHREKEKETDIKSYLVEWYIKQPWVKTLDNTYNSYKQADSVNFSLNWRTDSCRLWKGIFSLNYRVIFSTQIELYNQRWSKHCTSKHNRKWIQQNYDFMGPWLQKRVRNENGL